MSRSAKFRLKTVNLDYSPYKYAIQERVLFIWTYWRDVSDHPSKGRILTYKTEQAAKDEIYRELIRRQKGIDFKSVIIELEE